MKWNKSDKFIEFKEMVWLIDYLAMYRTGIKTKNNEWKYFQNLVGIILRVPIPTGFPVTAPNSDAALQIGYK